MGIYDRDYLRSDAGGRNLLGDGVGSMCKRIIALNVIVYVLQFLSYTSEQSLTYWLELDPAAVFGSGQIWRIITYAFCHDPRDPMHILFNMLFLWWFGNELESMYGGMEFLRFYLTGAVVAGVGFLALALLTGKPSPAIGASGAVMAVTMVYAMYYPRNRIYLFFVIPLELRWLVVMYVFWDLYPVLKELGGVGRPDNVAHAAHLGGLLYGYLYKTYDLRYTRLLPNWKWSQAKRFVKQATGTATPVRIYNPPEESALVVEVNLDEKVDEILAKITAHGESSLTDAERQILKQASRRYKER